MTDAASSPFDDIRAPDHDDARPDEAAVEAVRARDGSFTKPPGSLGRLEEIAEWLAAWQGKAHADASTGRWSRSSPAITASSPQGVSRLSRRT